MEQGIIDAKSCTQRESLQPVHNQAECVMDWKHTEHGSSRFCRNLYCLNIGGQIILCQHNTLALSCCSGSEDNGRNILCIRADRI